MHYLIYAYQKTESFVYQWLYKLKTCSKKECCKQQRYVKFKGTMTKCPVQKPTHRTTQNPVEHLDATDI